VAICDLTVQMRERMVKHAKGRGQIGRIVGSVNPLIPKPGTAYQWIPMEDPAVTDRKIKRLRSLVAGLDNVYFNIKSERHSYYQALLSLGDRRVAPVIAEAEQNGQNWRAAVADTGVDADFFIFRDRSRDAVLPWDVIDGGMKGDGGPLLVLLIRFENEVANTVLCRRVGQRPEQREAAALSVHAVRARRKRDVAAVAAAAFPDRKPHQLQALERSIGEVKLRVGKFAGRIPLVVCGDLDRHPSDSFCGEPPATGG
jgi:hypothetical protein